MDLTQFYNAQKPPKNLTEYEIADWYNEKLQHIGREGYTYQGTRITGDHFWFLNFCPINVTYTKSDGSVVDEVNFPLFCQTDDWLFKQIEEADQDGKKAIFLMTGRGFGKTLIVLSTGLKEFWFRDNFYGIISSATDALVNPCFGVFKDTIERINKAHPTIAVPLLKSKDDFVRIGEQLTSEGEENKKQTIAKGQMEKITYGTHAGKTKGRRLHWQLMEEVGSWDQPGNAKLKNCIINSMGTWKVQNTKKARVFLIGTGGEVYSQTIKDIYSQPDAYDIFVPTSYEKRKGIFIPCTHKMFYEETGVPDIEKAKQYHDAERKKLEHDIPALIKYCSEYPYTEEEVFRLNGTNSFPQELIGRRIQRITEFGEGIKPKRGRFFRKKQRDLSEGVEFQEDETGPVFIYEEPEYYRDDLGSQHAIKNLYIAGYDGIDQGKDDSASTDGSKMALLIKKNMNPVLKMQTTSNKYICKINYRPNDVDEGYEQCMLALIYYDAKVNIEYSKINIVSYFKQFHQEFRFLKRPKLANADGLQEKESRLIGTIANEANWGFGIGFIKQYIKENWDQIDDLEMLEQARDFSYENRGEFDIISAWSWCEIAYSETVVKPVTTSKQEVVSIGYYTDPISGKKVYGKKPDTSQAEIKKVISSKTIKYLDLQQNRVVYDDE